MKLRICECASATCACCILWRTCYPGFITSMSPAQPPTDVHIPASDFPAIMQRCQNI